MQMRCEAHGEGGHSWVIGGWRVTWEKGEPECLLEAWQTEALQKEKEE
jgi:hypothetical protein